MGRFEDSEFVDVRGDRDVRSIGPFTSHPVTVNGWTVPHLEAFYQDSGTVSLTLDHRFGMDVPQDLAGQVIEFLADAIAIALGWSCHPTSPEWTPDNDVPGRVRLPWHQMRGISSIEAEEE